MLDGAHVRVLAETEAEHRERQAFDHDPARGVVRVHHRRAAGLGRIGEQLEQAPFGARVRLEGSVKIEMVLGEVREHCHVEGQLLHTLEDEGVRGHFEDDAPHAHLEHLGQHGLDVQRFRRGLARLVTLVTDHVLNGADDAGAEPAPAQERLHQVRGRRLAVGAGDADQREPSRRMSVVQGGQPRQSPTR